MCRQQHRGVWRYSCLARPVDGWGVRRPGRIAVERDVRAGCDLEPVLAQRVVQGRSV